MESRELLTANAYIDTFGAMPESFKLMDMEFLSCRKNKDDAYDCNIYNWNAPGIPIITAGTFDIIDKDILLKEAGNNEEHGFINVYPRKDEVVICEILFVDGSRVLHCTADPTRLRGYRSDV